MSEIFLQQKELKMDLPLSGEYLKNVKEIEIPGVLSGNANGLSAKITEIPIGTLPSLLGWTHDITFSATDADTVAWTSGTITLSNGKTYSIEAGNTGNMTGLNFIYLDILVSETVLQKTTTAGNSVGASKILIAVAQNNSDAGSKAKFQAFGGKGGVLLTVDNIAANSASVNEFVSNTAQIKDGIITNAKIADLEAGKITVVGGKLPDSKIDSASAWNAKLDAASVGDMAFEDAVELAKLGSTILSGGYLQTILINADLIQAGTLVGRTIKTATPAAGVGEAVVIEGGTSKYIKLYYNASEVGFIRGYTTDGSEVTYVDIQAASGRKIKLKNSYIEIDGDLCPSSDEGNDCGQSNRKWNNVRGQTIWQQTNTDGSRHVYDFAYIEKGLINEKLLKKVAKKSDGMESVNGFIPELSLPFKQGTVLGWSSRGLRESKNEKDFAVAVASEKGLPIVLGAEPVRIIGKAKIGDYIVPSGKNGCAMAISKKKYICGQYEVIGRCLENKRDHRERLIKVMIKF